MAWRSIDGRVVVPQFDVVVRFNVHLSAPIADILDADNLGGDGVVETIADGDVVVCIAVKPTALRLSLRGKQP
jgi:hypothetical protein